MFIRFFIAGVMAVILFGCGSMPPSVIGDSSLVVNTPIYRANKIFHMINRKRINDFLI